MLLNPPDPQQDIPARLHYVVGCLPNQPAIVDESGEISYATLDRQSNQLAIRLTQRFGTEPEPIALLLPYTGLAATGILGVLKAGKFCVSLDPLSDVISQRAILQASAASILLTSSKLLSLAQAIAAPEIQIIAIDTQPYLEGASPPPSVTLNPRSFGTVSFSSGSTGKPKGIIRDHAGWLNAARLYNLHDHIGLNDRLAQVSSPTYVHYSTVTLGALLNGATLCYYPTATQQLHGLFDWVRQQAITVLSSSSSLMRDLLAVNQPLAQLPSLRVVMLMGTTIRAQELARLPELLSPNCIITNRLTMTEFSSITRYVITAQDLQATSGPLPVGYPCDGNTVILIDENDKPVPPGEVGQIIVKSRYISPGYWRNPELTAAKILPDPTGGDERILLTGDLGRMRPDGCLEYLGRKDFMVKVRGFSVEPEAIENVLLTHSNIHECVVVSHLGKTGEARLVAYIAPRQMPGPTTSDLREHLSRSLPSHMLPARFVIVLRLAHNTSGKAPLTCL